MGVLIGQPVWQTPPTSRVVLVDNIGFLLFTYLYLNSGNLSNTPHVERSGFPAYDDPSLNTPPGYGQSICFVQPDVVTTLAVCHTPVSASSSDLHATHGGVMHAQKPFEVK